MLFTQMLKSLRFFYTSLQHRQTIHPTLSQSCMAFLTLMGRYIGQLEFENSCLIFCIFKESMGTQQITADFTCIWKLCIVFSVTTKPLRKLHVYIHPNKLEMCDWNLTRFLLSYLIYMGILQDFRTFLASYSEMIL